MRMKAPPAISCGPKRSPSTAEAKSVAQTGSEAKMTPASVPSTSSMAHVSMYSTPAVVTRPTHARMPSVSGPEERMDAASRREPAVPSVHHDHAAIATARVTTCQTVQPMASNLGCFACSSMRANMSPKPMAVIVQKHSPEPKPVAAPPPRPTSSAVPKAASPTAAQICARTCWPKAALTSGTTTMVSETRKAPLLASTSGRPNACVR
mmetsp:Transcript_94102/g.249867  ORF Transcript_94102/g.249867 Transcript_94102/m.249867 type:complete len:208 (-) Transcript_94102:526-1149(-)